MSDLTFIDWDTKTILENIKTEYEAESGESMEIGSNEMAIASAVAYIFGVAKDLFNDMAKQRFIDTATGVYLDAHASNSGVARDVTRFPYTDDGDEQFREYIKLRRASTSVAGPASAYRQIILENINTNVGGVIDDVYIAQSGDTNFEAGYVSIWLVIDGMLSGVNILFEEMKPILQSVYHELTQNEDIRKLIPLNDTIKQFYPESGGDMVGIASVVTRQVFGIIKYNSRVHTYESASESVLSHTLDYINDLKKHFNSVFSMSKLSEIAIAGDADIIAVYAQVSDHDSYIEASEDQILDIELNTVDGNI